MKHYKEILTEKITKASRVAFRKIIEEKPNERFFAFVLLTLDDVLSCYAYANSQESHKRAIIKYDIKPETTEEKHAKWSPQEWEYTCIARNEFDEVYDYSEQILRGMDGDNFHRYKLNFIECMENALMQLDKEGMFGIGEKRDEITLFLTVSDSFMAEEVEEKSCKKLNSPKDYEVFKKRFE